jgi:hypothetical protein
VACHAWIRRGALVAGCGVALLTTLHAFQPRAFREYPGVEYSLGEVPLPPDWNQPAEFAFVRLMFPGGWNDGYCSTGRFCGDFRRGLSLWTQDYPRADRHFLGAVRRLTRIDTRSVEQVVNLEDGDEVYNWPWVYAVQVGEWGLTPAEGKVLRDYLLRGGFFMADDLHGTVERQVFADSMKLVFPERPIVELDSSEPIFHTAFDLDDRYQIPGQAHLRLGYKADGIGGRWQAILDDKGRVMIGITANSDVGDSWEYADDPTYPERFSALGIRLGVNYILYAMTH